MTQIKEDCGIFGIFGDPQAVQKTYFGLHSLQHRGQESAGIASSNGDLIHCFTGMGQVSRVFRTGQAFLSGWIIQWLSGMSLFNFQLFQRATPAVFERIFQRTSGRGPTATSLTPICCGWWEAYRHFQILQRYEIIVHLPQPRMSPNDPLGHVLNHYKGLFSALLFPTGLRPQRSVRNPPACLGKTKSGAFCVASETCALTPLATYMRGRTRRNPPSPSTGSQQS